VLLDQHHKLSDLTNHLIMKVYTLLVSRSIPGWRGDGHFRTTKLDNQVNKITYLLHWKITST
jgi:hypothetical protein